MPDRQSPRLSKKARGLGVGIAVAALLGFASSLQPARVVERPDTWRGAGVAPSSLGAAPAVELPLHVYDSHLVHVGFSADGAAALAFGSEGAALRSTDDGQTWQPIDVPTRQFLVASLTNSRSGSIVVVGARGTILRSDDVGERFDRTSVNTEQSFRAISGSADGRLLLAVGDGGTAYVSRDDGRTFHEEQTPRADYLSHVVALPRRDRFVVAGDNGALLLRDDGVGWRAIPAVSTEAGLFTALTVLPSGKLLAATQAGSILSSEDDGESWRSVHEVGSSSFVVGFDLDPAGSSVAARMRRGELLISSDQGVTFVASSSSSKAGVARLAWVNGRGFIGVAGDGGSLSSDPAGKRWFSESASGLHEGPLQMAVHPTTGTVLVVGRAGLIARSTDRGRRYQVVRPGLGGSLRALADNTAGGCLVGVGLAATVVHSLDSGKSWQRVPVALGSEVELNGVVVEPKSRALIVGGSAGTLLRSNDCARSWSVVRGATTEVNSLQVGESSTILALPARAPVLRSTDAGKTFVPAKMPGDSTLKCALSITTSDWVAVGDGGRIYRSTDDGRTFGVIASGTDANLRALAYDRATRALWIAGDSAVVLRSTDGGVTWTRVVVPSEENLFVIGLHPNGGVIWVGGNRGAALRSTDGERFESVASGSTQTIRVITFDPVSKEFVLAGAGGTLLRTVDGAHISNVKNPLEGRIDAALVHAPSAALFLGGERLVRLGAP